MLAFGRGLILAVALLTTLATGARGGEGSIHGILSAMGTCQGCHVADAPDAGGLNPEPTDGNEVLGTWQRSLVNVPPENEAARDAGKLRIHAFVPWNSFLLDKLTGDLKDGEGEAMRGALHPAGQGTGEPAEIHRCPGLIDELSNWILAGAPGAPAIAPGDFDWPWIECSRPQQPLGSLAAPDTGRRIVLGPFSVERPEREAVRILENVTVGNSGVEWVNRFEVLASAGTEYLAVYRTGESIPLVVARGQRNPSVPYNRWNGDPNNRWNWVPEDTRVRLDVQLPEGVAVPLGAGQTLTIEHRIRNDFWVGLSRDDYVNRTTGEAIVNFHTIPAGSVVFEAEPVLDATGTELLAAAPGAIGVSGGTFAGVMNGGVFGVWTDLRSIATTLTAPAAAGIPLHSRPVLAIGTDVTRGYASVAPQAPGQAVAYTCTHSNGFHDSSLPANARPGGAIQLVSRPLRFGCTSGADEPGLLPGSEPTDVCHRASDCQAPESCEPVTLVGGNGVHDGRCSLVGLVW